MERQRQLDRTEVGSEMAAGHRHRFHDEGPDFFGQSGQLVQIEPTEIGR